MDDFATELTEDTENTALTRTHMNKQDNGETMITKPLRAH